MKSCRLLVAKIELLTILDGRKRKGKRKRKMKMLIIMNPTVSLVTKVEVEIEVVATDGAMVVETMEETDLMDCR